MKVPSARGAAPATVGTPAAGTRARATYDALLESTERLLATGGYPAASSTAIAAAAGVATGSFYRYFRTRDDALGALFARRLEELLTEVGAVLSTELLLDDGVEEVLRRALSVVLGHYREHAATFRAALVQLPSAPPIRQVYWDAHRASENVLVSFLRRGQRARAVREGDPRVLAQTLLVVVQATNTPLLLADGRSSRTRAIERELHRLLVHLLAPRA